MLRLNQRPLLSPDHPHLEPRHFVDEKAVSENHKDYMFLQCILFITEVRATAASISLLRLPGPACPAASLLPDPGGLFHCLV